MAVGVVLPVWADATCERQADQAVMDAQSSHRLGLGFSAADSAASNRQAFKWFCDAALQNHAKAQLQVALMLLEGKGVTQNIAAGMAWLESAVVSGNHDAELILGTFLVNTNPARSAELFSRSSAGGNLHANHQLAELYYYGVGVAQDYVRAEALAAKGAVAGFVKSRTLLARIRAENSRGQLSQSTRQLAAVSGAESTARAPKPAEPPAAALPEKSQAEATLLEQLKAKVAGVNTTPDKAFVPATSGAAPVAFTAAAKPATSGTDAAVATAQRVETPAEKPVVEVRSGHTISAGPAGSVVSEKTAQVEFTPAQPDSSPVQEQGFLRSASWVAEQADSHAAIQLVQASQLEGILRFIQQHGLESQAYYVQARKPGSPNSKYRYILLFGRYSSTAMAKDATKNLPPAVQKSGYWVRNFADIKRSYQIK